MATKKKVKLKFTAPKRTQVDIAIEERLAGCGRKESEHIIYVGQLVERMLNSEFGAVLKALTAGRTSAEISANRDSKTSSDRILGRIEMADALWSDLEQFVLDKDVQLRPLENNVIPTKNFVTESADYARSESSFTYSP